MITNKIAPIENLKIPPHSIDAEQSVLGSILVDNQAIDKVSWLIRPEDFYSLDNQEIYRVIVKLAADNKPIDLVTVTDELSGKSMSDEPVAYVAQLVRNTPSSANIKSYAHIIKERALIRQTIGAANTIIETCFNAGDRKAIDILGFAESELGSVSELLIKPSSTGDAETVLDEVINEMEARCKSGEEISGLSTGLPALDDRIDGLEPSELVIIAARPSMGKTTLALNIIREIATTGGNSIIFSLETSRKKIMRKILSDLSRVFQGKLKNASELEDTDWQRIAKAMEIIKGTTLEIVDDYHMTIPKMRLELRRYRKKHGAISVIMVDYIQLMSGSTRTDNRTNEISEISRGLKAIAKEFNCPVIALSQLNRGLENRSNKRPIMSDLRESGQIEQDADKIIFIYRDEVYNENSDYKGIAELIVAKSKEGEIGKEAAQFNGAESRFQPSTLNAETIQEEAPTQSFAERFSA